jgi:hypothetical protein
MEAVMKLLLHVSIWAVLVGGCATTGVAVVPTADWQSVPTSERAAIDRATDGNVEVAQADVRAAEVALQDARRQVQTRVAARAVTPQTPATGGDSWVAAMRDHEQIKSDAMSRVASAKQNWLAANVVWREQRLAAAIVHASLMNCKRELDRADAIDQHLRGSDTYDVATYRGQVGHAQEQWYVASSRAVAARDGLELASAKLASAKEAFAQLVRSGPTFETASTHMRLSGFTVADSDRRAGRRVEKSYLSLSK